MFVQRAIVDGVVDDVKTKYSKAGLPLDPALAEMLIRLREQSKFQSDEDWVFASWRTLGRKPLRSTAVLHNFLKPAAQRAGLGLIGWHASTDVLDSAARQWRGHQGATRIDASRRHQNHDESLHAG